MSLHFDYKVFTTHNLVVIVKIKQIKHMFTYLFSLNVYISSMTSLLNYGTSLNSHSIFCNILTSFLMFQMTVLILKVFNLMF